MNYLDTEPQEKSLGLSISLYEKDIDAPKGQKEVTFNFIHFTFTDPDSKKRFQQKSKLIFSVDRQLNLSLSSQTYDITSNIWRFEMDGSDDIFNLEFKNIKAKISSEPDSGNGPDRWVISLSVINAQADATLEIKYNNEVAEKEYSKDLINLKDISQKNINFDGDLGVFVNYQIKGIKQSLIEYFRKTINNFDQLLQEGKANLYSKNESNLDDDLIQDDLLVNFEENTSSALYARNVIESSITRDSQNLKKVFCFYVRSKSNSMSADKYRIIERKAGQLSWERFHEDAGKSSSIEDLKSALSEHQINVNTQAEGQVDLKKYIFFSKEKASQKADQKEQFQKHEIYLDKNETDFTFENIIYKNYQNTLHDVLRMSASYGMDLYKLVEPNVQLTKQDKNKNTVLYLEYGCYQGMNEADLNKFIYELKKEDQIIAVTTGSLGNLHAQWQLSVNEFKKKQDKNQELCYLKQNIDANQRKGSPYGGKNYIYSLVTDQNLEEIQKSIDNAEGINEFIRKNSETGHGVLCDFLDPVEKFLLKPYTFYDFVERDAVSKKPVLKQFTLLIPNDKYFTQNNYQEIFSKNITLKDVRNEIHKLNRVCSMMQKIEQVEYQNIQYLSKEAGSTIMYEIIVDKKANEYASKNPGMNIHDLIKKIREQFGFCYMVKTISLANEFKFYSYNPDMKKVVIDTIKLAQEKDKEVLHQIAHNSDIKDISDFLDQLQKRKIQFTYDANQNRQTVPALIKSLWKPSSDKDFTMTKWTYVFTGSAEQTSSNLQTNATTNNSLANAANGIFDDFQNSLRQLVNDKKLYAPAGVDLNTYIFKYGHDEYYFELIKEEERFAFFFLDVDNSDKAVRYVIDPCLDKNTPQQANFADTDENRLWSWNIHYADYKKMSGYKFSTFWNLYSNDHVKIGLQNASNNIKFNDIKISAPEAYQYGGTVDSKKYRIGISDNARSDAGSTVFDPIRKNIYDNWVWGNPSYSCLHYGPNANGSGCYELRYSRDLQRKGYTFNDT